MLGSRQSKHEQKENDSNNNHNYQQVVELQSYEKPFEQHPLVRQNGEMRAIENYLFKSETSIASMRNPLLNAASSAVSVSSYQTTEYKKPVAMAVHSLQDNSYSQSQIVIGSKCKNIFLQSNVTTQILFPLGITGLLVKDIVTYYQDPSTRFAATLFDVITGTAFKNPFYGVSTLFSIKPLTTNYWLPLTTILGVSLTERVGRCLPIKIQTPECVSNRLMPLYSCVNNLNDRIHPKIKTVANVLGTIGSVNGWYHFFKFILNKNIIFLSYLIARNNCLNSQRDYVYLSHIVDYSCMLCGQWDFVNPIYANSNQYCLDALLDQQFEPEVMLPYLKRLAYPGNRAEVIDITLSNRQSLLAQSQSEEIFETLANTTARVNRFTFSSQAREYTEGQVGVLGNFIEKTKPDDLTIKNQNFGSHTPLLFKAIGRATSKSVLLNNVGIDNGLGRPLFNNLSNSTESVSLPNNKLSNEVLVDVNRFLQRSETKSIALDANPITGIAPLFQNINGTRVDNVSLSKTKISSKDAKEIGQALPRHPIKTVKLSSCQIDDDKLVDIGEGFDSQEVEILDLSDNQFGDDAIYFIDKWPPNLRELNISNNPRLTAKGYYYLFQKLKETNIRMLILDHNKLPFETWGYLADFIRKTKLEDLSINSCGFTDQAIDAFCNGHPGDSKYLTTVSFNDNDCTEKGFKQMARLFNSSNVTNLNGNCSLRMRIDILATYQREMRGRLTTHLNAGGTKVDSITAGDAINLLPGSNTKYFDVHNTAWDDPLTAKLITNLITNSPSMEDLSQEVLSDKTELTLFHSAKPATNITTMNLEGSQVSRNSTLALSRVLPFTNINHVKFSEDARIKSYPRILDSGNNGIICPAVSGIAAFFAMGYCIYKLGENIHGLFKRCRNKPSQNQNDQGYEEITESKRNTNSRA